MMFKEFLKNEIQTVVGKVYPDIQCPDFEVEDTDHADAASNIALVLAGILEEPPHTVAGDIKDALEGREATMEKVLRIEVAGPGFLNFFLKDEVFTDHLREILERGEAYGENTLLQDKKVAIEYTDPNPFKEFHIGHLFPNTVGESLSRVFARSGAEVRRMNYQGDVGMHVAKAIWGILAREDEIPGEETPLEERVKLMGAAYARGANAYKDHEEAKVEIQSLNKAIYENSDERVNKLYEKGRAWSLEYFETLYAKLGTEFDDYFYESNMTENALEIVRDHMARGVFEKSDGAVIYPGEKHGLHNRVFINSFGLPTYEAKELALAGKKYECFPYDLSYVVASNELKEYFEVLLSAMELVAPDFAKRTHHVANGTLRFKSGKMSSRTGNVISAETLIEDVSELVREKMKASAKSSFKETLEREETTPEIDELIEDVAIAAVKFTILRQAVGGDIIFDEEEAISFEGHSGPYLQYTHARLCSVLEKGRAQGREPSLAHPEKPGELERELFEKLPEAVRRALEEKSPHTICHTLLEVASSYNSYYGQNKILGNDATPYRLALTDATRQVLENGLQTLGIAAPMKM